MSGTLVALWLAATMAAFAAAPRSAQPPQPSWIQSLNQQAAGHLDNGRYVEAATMALSVLLGRRSGRVLAALHTVPLASTAQGPGPVDSVLRSFLDADPRTFLRRLEARRAPAIPPEIKGRILDALPLEGRVTNLSKSMRRKLGSLEAVLRLHQRDSVYGVMVIAVPQARTGLHARAVVLISERALDLLDTAELQAVVAHEIAHEYVWAQHQEANQSKNHRRLQELELYCDGIAIMTMLRLGEDPLRLITGLDKILRTNQQHLGWGRNEDDYPSLTDRRRFAKAVTEWAAAAVKP